MNASTRELVAPGIAFQTLLHNAPRPALRELIGSAIMDTIRGLDPDLSADDHLGELAARMIEPLAALQDVRTRRQILRMLPLPKARELAHRLGIQDGRTLYDDLCSKASDSAAIEVLLSFFGVVRIPRAPADVVPDAMHAVSGYPLFKHQRTAADRVVDVLAKPPHKVVLHMPTGSGKTRTAMHIVASRFLHREPTVVCWLAQSVELLEQAADEFQSAWQHLGNRNVDLVRFWGHRSPNVLEVHDGLIVAGLAKASALSNRDPATLLRLADRVSLTIVDEAHQAIAPTYSEVLTALHSKRPHNALFGLTATPGRSWSDVSEDRALSDYFDRRKVTLEVHGYDDPVDFLIDQGYLARPVFRTLNSEAGLELGDADVKALSTAMDVPNQILDRLGADTRRNLKILSSVADLLARHSRVIVFAPSVQSARILTAILSVQGYTAFLVTSATSASERDRVIVRFRSAASTPMVLVNYGVLTTGFDAPATNAAVIARPTRSLVLYSQMVGRATRGPRVGGNHQAEIVTVADPHLPGFGSIADAFKNWEDVWSEPDRTN